MAGHLTHSPADIVRWLLIAKGLGTEPAAQGLWPISASAEPPTPDNSITIYNTQGRPQGRIQMSGQIQEFYGLQIRVRAITDPIAYSKAQDLAIGVDQQVLLDQVDLPGIVGTDTLSYLVHCITRTGNVLSLGKEATSKRFIYVFNAIVALQPCIPCP